MPIYGYRVRFNCSRGIIIQDLYREFGNSPFTTKEAVSRGIKLSSPMVASMRRDKIIESTNPGIQKPYEWKLTDDIILKIVTSILTGKL